METESDFVGRQDWVKQLTEWVHAKPVNRLRIVSISGQGGAGKSYLVEHTLRGLDLSQLGFLKLSLCGTGVARTLSQLVTSDLIKSSTQLNQRDNHFVLTGRCRRAIERIDADIRRELEAIAKQDGGLAPAVGQLLSIGAGALELFKMSPKVQVAVKLGKQIQPEHFEAITKALGRGKAYAQEAVLFNGIFGDPFDRGLRNHLRLDLEKTLADCLVGDLSAMLRRYRKEDRFRPMRPKVSNLSKFLLVVDDYESMPASLGSFLVDNLIPLLAGAKFESMLVIIGRDRLIDTHVAWQQHYDRHVIGEIRLASFTQEEAEQYIRKHGITDAALVKRIVHETSALPYLIASEVEAELSGGRSALALKRFFDRTTRWMTQQQRHWLLALSFVEEVNLSSIRAVLGDQPAAEVLEWFKNEASIRSPTSARWTILPIIRSRVQEYVRNDSQSMYEDLKKKGMEIRE